MQAGQPEQDDTERLAEEVQRRCHHIRCVYRDTGALKQELKPVCDIVRFVADLLEDRAEGRFACELGPVLKSLDGLAGFLERHGKASEVGRLTYAASLRDQVKVLLQALCQALQPEQGSCYPQLHDLVQAFGETYSEIDLQHRRKQLQQCILEARQDTLLQLEIQYTLIRQVTDRLNHQTVQAKQSSDNQDALQGQARIVRALGLQQVRADREQLAADAQRQLEQARDDQADASELCFLEQVTLPCLAALLRMPGASASLYCLDPARLQ
ncbi:hypothetical protein MMC07_002606 [Pseudocyphellaria aurata]|nr:hypothetical protein [Pseudocyphellaria aurata]